MSYKNFFLICLLVTSFVNCNKPKPVDFHILVESFDSATEKKIKKILSIYPVGEFNIIPSYNSKICYFNGREFISAKIFEKNGAENVVNLKMNEKKLENELENLEINLFAPNNSELQKLSLSNVNTYADDLGHDHNIRYYSRNNAGENQTRFEITLPELANKIDIDLGDHILDNSYSVSLVIALPTEPDNTLYEQTGPVSNPEQTVGNSSDGDEEETSPAVTGTQFIGRAKVKTMRSDLHLRSAPRIRSDNIMSRIPKNTVVSVIEQSRSDYIDGASNFWYKVKHLNNIGYMWGGYLDIDNF